MNEKQLEAVGQIAAEACAAMGAKAAKLTEVRFAVEPGDGAFRFNGSIQIDGDEKGNATLTVPVKGTPAAARKIDYALSHEAGLAVMEALKIDPALCGGLTLQLQPGRPVVAHVVRYLLADETAKVLTTLRTLGNGWTEMRRGKYVSRAEEVPCEPLPEMKK